MGAIAAIPGFVAALFAAFLPHRHWRRLPVWIPVTPIAFLSGIATLFLGAAIGIPGFLDHAHANAGLGIDAALKDMYRTETYRGDLVIGFSGLSVFTFLLLTPKGWLTLYLVISGGVRAGAAWFDDHVGDPLLTGLDYWLIGRRDSLRDARQRRRRETEEGPEVPDRIVTAAAAGVPPCDLVVVSSRRKPGWERGTAVFTANAVYRIGDPVEQTIAGRLRTLYPLTEHGDFEAIRRSVHYDLPPPRDQPE
jgi:hypothetical protein